MFGTTLLEDLMNLLTGDAVELKKRLYKILPSKMSVLDCENNAHFPLNSLSSSEMSLLCGSVRNWVEEGHFSVSP